MSGPVAVALVFLELYLRPSNDLAKSKEKREEKCDITLKGLSEFCTKFANKDLMARCMHYGSRMMKGIFKDIFPSVFWNARVSASAAVLHVLDLSLFSFVLV
jgi:hypothetical protein